MEQFGNYWIDPINKIGEGGYGYVEEIDLYTFSQVKCTTGSYVRKKILPLHSGKQDLLLRFKREVLYQAECNQNRNIVTVVMHNLNVPEPWFVMERGKCNLTQVLTANPSLSEKKKIISNMLDGLDYLHNTKKFLHRDLKPDNVILGMDGIYKWSDFGLVKSTDTDKDTAQLTQIFQTYGYTEYYAAPEVRSAAQFSIHSDIYSLGIILEQFKEDDLNSIIAKCTMHRPGDRYLDVADIIKDFRVLSEEWI